MGGRRQGRGRAASIHPPDSAGHVVAPGGEVKRIPRTYRLRDDYVREIDRIAAEHGVDRTKVVEAALELYLSPTVTMMAPDDGSPGSDRDAAAAAEPAAR